MVRAEQEKEEPNFPLHRPLLSAQLPHGAWGTGIYSCREAVPRAQGAVSTPVRASWSSQSTVCSCSSSTVPGSCSDSPSTEPWHSSAGTGAWSHGDAGLGPCLCPAASQNQGPALRWEHKDRGRLSVTAVWVTGNCSWGSVISRHKEQENGSDAAGLVKYLSWKGAIFF